MHLVEREPVECQPEPSASAASTSSTIGSQGAGTVCSHTIISAQGDNPAGGTPVVLDQDISSLPYERMQASELEFLIEPEPAPYDALTIIFDTIDRLEDVFQMRYNPWRNAQRVMHWTTRVAEFWNNEDSSLSPTPEFFSFVLDRTDQLLTNHTSRALRSLASRLQNSAGSSDRVVRLQTQFAATNLGATLQHLGALILELGRASMCLHMGDITEQGVVLCGPAVYITQDGINPMLLQLFQPGSSFETRNQVWVEQPEPIVSTSQAHDITTSTGVQTHGPTLPPQTPVEPIHSLCNVTQSSSTQGLLNAIMISDTQPETLNSTFTSELRSLMPEFGDQDDPLLGQIDCWLHVSSEESSEGSKQSESEEK